MQLKQYQTDTLTVLRRFFEEARIGGAKGAYEAIANEPEQAGRLGRYGGVYNALTGLPDVPYVCLRLPTGGGKTVLGTHAVSIARDAWVEKDWPMVLWLTPTKTIRRQTAEALKDPGHPYRQALDEAYGARVRVFDIADFAHIRPNDIQDHCCVVISTIQSLRVKDTEGRKVYAHNENLEPHFSALAKVPAGLETLDGGGVKFSFANLMHIHRPLMIVDEAHNAVTGLTREMQARVNPCAIVEFTATPRLNSNILYSVSAQELKAEDMVKLPIMLAEHDSWQNAVNGAVLARAALAETAADDSAYLRPIVLFQAQKKNEDVTVATLRKHLIEVERIPERRIAVATGDQRELDGIDLFDPACQIEHVITIEALKEGWDCSFAYVFCSVARIQSAKDVEQLLGRVLRMPYAQRRKAEDLNRAYAFLSESVFGEAARALVDKLVAMGFDEEEALENIEPTQDFLGNDSDLFEPRDKPRAVFEYEFSAVPEALTALLEGEGVTVREREDGSTGISITGHVSEELEYKIVEKLPEAERSGFSEAAAQYRTDTEELLSPAERGESFTVPRLLAHVRGELKVADLDLFMEHHDWSLLDHSPKLKEAEFAIRETSRTFEIDLDGNSVKYQYATEEEQLALNANVEGWTPHALVLWLDRQTRQADVGQAELLRWLSNLVGHLVDDRDMHIAALMRCKFILARKIRKKIATIRHLERASAYKQYLFGPKARVEVSFDRAFRFRDGIYQVERNYRGPWKPRKHFIEQVPAFDGAPDGEEFQCAQALDSLSEVRFWLRNVARHPSSFWLPTASDKFYPDFVAQLEDSRILVVEYKGARDIKSDDTREKRTIGELWERRSEGEGLFIVVENSKDGKDMRAQLAEKIA